MRSRLLEVGVLVATAKFPSVLAQSAHLQIFATKKHCIFQLNIFATKRCFVQLQVTVWQALSSLRDNISFATF